MKQKREDIRNVAIIAHVDHGKTTLVDELLKQSGTFRENQAVQERVMDSGDIERERGITILSKNTSVHYKDYKINIVDTPGHADFGGEVERILKMVDGVVLVVDSFEGPMPQTRFVLKNALNLDLPVVVCVNKMDRPEARPEEVTNEVLELFMDLEANDDQLDSPFVYASARNGWASLSPDEPGTSMEPLFDTILNYIPAPMGDPDGLMHMLVSTIDYNEYVGRIGIGKVESGILKEGMEAVLLNIHDPEKKRKVKISKVFVFRGLSKGEVKSAQYGTIVAVSGIDDIHIGDTLCEDESQGALPFVKISEPTLSMTFSVNDSPFAGQEGKYVTSRHLRDRLYRELNTDVSLRVEDGDTTECFKVSGRGELHLSILIETMRREGYEFQVSKPEVLFKEIIGEKYEPMESVTIDVDDEFTGAIIEKLGKRKGEITNMFSGASGRTRIEFYIPARGLIGYRSEFLTDTRGTGIINSVFCDYAPYKGDIASRQTGSLVAFETGEAVAYGLFNAQERGVMYIEAGTKVYAGMIVGKNAKAGDIEVNVCKKKQLTNMRASGSDDALKLIPPMTLTIEQSLAFIGDDELLEVTPKSLRMRKAILDARLRKKAMFGNKN